MLEESSPNRLTIMKGGITMRILSSDFDARLTALEEYVDMPAARTGKTITGRLDAQHVLLEALRVGQSELNRRMANLEVRMTNVEIGLGKALHGITEIKNLLTRLADSTPDHGLNSSSPP
jgi:hypothetical protein